ncbi:hypothetical protein SEA_STICKYNOTE_94 [Corynebacterium phage Stickynote]|uniref:Uncharacterized protein n=1 Tax=Corynebacterium phage Stickynote TaxID=2588503 RepID=A0A4Y6EMN3_9CAUD|nr:hypothetical protein KNU65_gp48 [Corynebacterium phage Stickynote]QDF19287.1 hypothetical protein SEA_STICKYNOTE_94 [Corynebacterium phage Stickynote]
MEIFAIDNGAPVKSVRENVDMYLGDSIKVSDTAAHEIIKELEAYGYEWMIHVPTGTTFMAGDPNHFLTAVASIIEL